MSTPTLSTSIPWSLVKNGFKKTPAFNSLVQETAAGRGNSGAALKPYPTWDFEADLNVIPWAMVENFLDCYMATRGRAGVFFFTDPIDNTVTLETGIMLNVTPGAAAPMGQAGDGVSTKFQLARLINTRPDITQNVSIVGIDVAGSPTVAYTVSSTGVVTFTSAPAMGAALTWSGTFKHLCRFTDDTLKDLAASNKNIDGLLWSCGSIGFKSEFLP